MELFHPYFFLLCLSIVLSRGNSGHIYSQPSEIIPQNCYLAKTIHLFFMIETPLVSGDCLFINFPMTIGGSSTGAISTSLDINTPATIITTPYYLDGTPPTTDIAFYQLTSSLNSNTWYRIQINLSDMNTQIAGVEGCIWFATTSDYHSNYITYDENRCFDLISFAPYPDSGVDTTVSFSFATQANVNTFGQMYGVNFDITPKLNVAPGALFRLVIAPGTTSTDTFTFGSSCSSVSCTANAGTTQDYCPTGGINAISSYNCSTNNNILNFNFNQVVSNKVFRISASLINPNAITTSSVTVFFMSQKAELYFSMKSAYALADPSSTTVLSTKYPTIISNLKSVSLFWGLTHQDTASKTGFVGCPIYLYTSNSNSYIVFNSLKTVFTLSTAIPSLSFHSNLQVIWTVIDTLNSVESFLMNSISSNFPGQLSCTSSISSGTVTCSNIKDLPVQDYYISGKFALARLSSFLSTLTPTPTSPICGGIEIKTGAGSNTVLTVTGKSIGVKKNIEYYDPAITGSADGANIFYNQIFTYWSSDTTEYNFQDSQGSVTNTLLTFQTKFLGLTSGKGAAAAVWPKGSIQKTQALFLLLKSSSSLMCSTSANYAGSVTSPCDGTGAAAVNYAVLLKIVFNNNVLGISSTSFTKGVNIIGTLFQAYSSSTIVYGGGNVENYNWLPQQTGTAADPLVNNIQKGGPSNAAFWHASVLCYAQTIDASCYNILAYSSTINPSVSGISFIDTNIATYPSLYADSTVFDFIICFKVLPYSSYSVSSSNVEDSWKLIEEGTTSASTYTAISGPGIINGYVITNSLDSNIGSTKLSVVNTYLKTSASADADFGYSNSYIKDGIPNYLRLGFTINSLNLGGSFIGIFLNGQIGATATVGMFSGLSLYSKDNGNINVLETSNNVHYDSSILGGLNAYYANNNDFWWAHSGFIIPASTSPTSNSFNFYIPMQATFINILSLNLVLLNQNQKNYQVQAIYRIIGSVFSSGIVSASYSITGSPSKTSYLLPTLTTGTFPSNYQTPWDQGANGCQSGVTTLASVTSPVIISPQTILPGKTINNFFIKADVLANSGIDDCRISMGNSGVNWGSAFILYARDVINFFDSTTLSWDFKGTAPSTNKCHHHLIYYGLKFIYTILCTADAGAGVSSFGSGSKGITLSQFTVPFFWGTSFALSQKLTYAWSDEKGRAVLHNPDSTDSSNWYYSSCVVDGLNNLPISTKDAPFTLKIASTQLNYTLSKGDSLILQIQTPQTDESFVLACDHSQLSCSVVSPINSPSFILTTSTNNYVFTAGTQITLKGWIDTLVAATFSYSLNIQYIYSNNGSPITYPPSEKCSSTGAVLSVSANKLSSLANITSISYVNMQNARGAFSITFNYPRIIRENYIFTLSIGVFGIPTVTNSNFRCLLYENGQVSNKWKTISSFNNVFETKITCKNRIDNGGNFAFTCKGGNSPDFSISSFFNPIYTYITRNSGDVLTDSETHFIVPNMPNSIQSTSVSLTKIFKSRGLDSDYVISFKPTANNVTTDGRIYIEFSLSIPPKLNKFGNLECYFNDILAFCEFLDERKISIWPIVPLLITASKQYTVRISGVTQPYSNAQDKNLKVYFALDLDNDPNNGLSEQTVLPDPMDTGTTPISAITIHDIQYTNNLIRSSTDITLVINLPLNSISANTTAGIWIQVPGSLATGLLYGWNVVSATMFRVYNASYPNLVRSITPKTGRRLYLSLYSDPDNGNSGLNYTLSIQNLFTSQQPPQVNYLRENILLFIASDNTTATSISASGSRNTSIYLNFQTNSSAILLNWLNENAETITFDNPLQVNVGFYKTKVFLTVGGTYQNTWYFSFIGGNISNILTQSPNPLFPLRVVGGSGDAYFYIACTKNTYVSARYFLSGVKTGDTNQIYSNLPFLDIRPTKSNCTPVVSGSVFDVPFSGGTSDPIIVDVSHCPPVDGINIFANISYGFNLTDNNGVSFSGAQNQTVTLSFSDMQGNYKAIFYVISNDNSNGSVVYQAGTIDFTIGGTNGDVYNSPNSVNINMIPSSKVPPTPMNPTVKDSILSVGCDEKGTNFFVLGLGNSCSKISLQTLSSKTLLNNVTLLGLDLKNDPNYKLYGYVVGLYPLVYTQVNLRGYLKAGGVYTVYSFCMSNNLISNNISVNYTWNQSDNGGKTVILRINFIRKLSSPEKVDFACGISKVLSISGSRVFTDEGSNCPIFRVLQNTSNSSNSTTSNTSNSSAKAYPVNFMILKDYLSQSDNTYQTVLNYAQQLQFITNVISQTQEGVANFPAALDRQASLTILDAFSYVTPIVNGSQSNATSSTINITLNLTNINGYLYCGLGYPNVTIPNITQLRTGIDGNGVALIYRFFDQVNTGGILNFTFLNLYSSTAYRVFFAGSNLDTSINAVASNVSYVDVMTSVDNAKNGANESWKLNNLKSLLKFIVLILIISLF